LTILLEIDQSLRSQILIAVGFVIQCFYDLFLFAIILILIVLFVDIIDDIVFVDIIVVVSPHTEIQIAFIAIAIIITFIKSLTSLVLLLTNTS
jgi:hypothetical protein